MLPEALAVRLCPLKTIPCSARVSDGVEKPCRVLQTMHEHG